MIELTQKLIRELFNYKNGFLYWKISKQGIQKDNKAGELDNTGYNRIKINYKSYKTHRIIFLYHKGYLPEFVDHIDRNKSNNNIENLREITNHQNQMNKNSYKNTSSQYKGVSWFKRDQKWMAQIRINYKLKYLGKFKLESDAAKAYNDAAIKYFGEFANLNKIG